nr:reverse transcriptase domain-containing protein [Tanacetum cinerariifolium]
MLKALLSNKEKLLELENTPLNENCSAVILKKLPEKLRDLGKFLILCGISELKCKALANLGSGPLPSNNIANPKEEDERVKETLTDPKLSEYTIKVPPPLV